MEKLTISDILKAAGGTLVCGDINTKISNVVTDSRTIENGALFVPIRGENFDGHSFIPQSLEKGAAGTLTQEDTPEFPGKAVIRVPDTICALGDIARYYKKLYNVPTVAVTGSVGKTTTKDMIYTALSSQKNTLKTEGNFNNNIGVPLTIFRLSREHEAAVIEMGMNHFGEIDYLSSIILPDIAVITNIGMSHIENLKSREGIYRAKTEVIKYLGKDKTLIVNGDDDYLKNAENDADCKVVMYGCTNPRCDVTAGDIKNNGLHGTEFTVTLKDSGESFRVKLNIPGEHNVYNALAAICVCREAGLETAPAIKALENISLTANRLEIEETNGCTLIKDYYNASPDSIRAALKLLDYADCKRRVAILGDVLEMGEYARDAHYALGADAAKHDLLLTAGENAKYIAEGAGAAGMKNCVSFKDTAELEKEVNNYIKPGDAVLIKASHGMHFEKIYEKLKETPSD